MAESLFSRLQKLNKEATPAPWDALDLTDGPWITGGLDEENGAWPVAEVGSVTGRIAESSDADAALIVECRNSLPAVLNLIEAAQPAVLSYPFPGEDEPKSDIDWYMEKLRAAVAVFVSGQEEQP